MNAPRGSERRTRLVRGVRIACGLLFVVQFAVLDLVMRGIPSAVDGVMRATAALVSIAVWSSVLALVTSRVSRIVAALVAATLLVVQVFVFRFIHVPLDLQVAEAARHSFVAIRPVVAGMLPATSLTIAVVAAIEFAILQFGRWTATRRTRIGLAVVALAAVALGPEPRRATPDIRAAHALGVVRQRPAVRMEGAVTLPALHSTRREMPDVLFILTESVRAADYVARGVDATATATADVTPGRFELDELRAISSYTAVSLSVVITGRSQEGSRDEILKAPNLFDFAHAARANVAYYSAQSRETFETKDVRAAVDHIVTLETLAGHDVDDDSEWVRKPLDRMVVDRFVAELPTRPHAAMTVLHLYGTHAPYYFEDAKAKFTPFERSVGWSEMPKLRNAYRNAIVEQDREVARAVRAFVAGAGQRPWLVVFTSDHGESFGEHAAIHHGQNLYDEQVRVPGWIAAGQGALTEAQQRALADHQERSVTHLDLLPTVLDALGLLDNFSVRGHAERMVGHSLLRAYAPHPPIPVTNCTGMFPCPLNTWGLFGEEHKLVAQAWDPEWRCLGTHGGEHLVPSNDPACVALRSASRRHFPQLPNGSPNR